VSSDLQGTTAEAKPAGFAAFGARLGWLTLAVLAVYPLLAGAAAAVVGSAAWLAAALAAALCWLGAAIALLIAFRFREPREAIFGVLLGMGFRMGLPLAALIVLAKLAPALADAGFFGLVLGFYLVTLATETLMSLTLLSRKSAAAKVS
jgi:hypothetical protein